jgi:hypothetical protein
MRSFSIPDNLTRVVILSICPVLNSMYCFLNILVFFYGIGMSTQCPTPSLEDQGVFLFWNLTVDLSSLGDPASSYAATGIALVIIGSHKTHHHDEAEAPSGWFYTSTVYKYDNIWLHILHCFDSATKHTRDWSITEYNKALSDRIKGLCQWRNSRYLTYCTKVGNYEKCSRNYRILSKCRGAEIFQKCMHHFKLLGARRVAWSKFCNEDPHLLGATVHN